MDAVPPRGPGGCSFLAVALAAAVLTTVWWGITAFFTENFGHLCLFYLGVEGPQAEHCYLVNDRAKAWLPRLVSVAWVGAVLVLCLPRRILPGRRTAAGVSVACLIVALVLGGHALSVP
ncbi:hypothetical protein ACFYTV_02410 [Streptomyces sp. NPDC004562]|uniref:hypothetical protein n=1 Tax=unclassified Streptomyces TaxID=2593676 RepID=UPI0036BA8C7C